MWIVCESFVISLIIIPNRSILTISEIVLWWRLFLIRIRGKEYTLDKVADRLANQMFKLFKV